MKYIYSLVLLCLFAFNAHGDFHITYYNEGASCSYSAIPYLIGSEGKPVKGNDHNIAIQNLNIKFEAKKRTIAHPSGEPQTLVVRGNQIYIYGFDTKNGLVLIYDGAEIEIKNEVIIIKKQGRVNSVQR